jgi:lipopolysaccharide transport system ATP-binding protein
MSAILVTGLGKAYRQYAGRWSRLAEWIFPGQGPRHIQHWVLRDISFRVEPGEAVGIIGINGAGKSTLLKLITGTTQPTAGSVEITGRIAALLELGMGFHPEFTGRQNVLMAGQLLGLGNAEIKDLMPEIEAFAEIGDYIDQPFRVYSSGMQMRLAFSVATVKRPDVLIVDEALSVGDAYFSAKSFERIRAFASAGTTLLIVSHDKQAIQSLCDRAILLDAGRLAKEGDPESVTDYYNALIADRQNATILQEEREDGRVATVSGTGDASIVDAVLLNEEGQLVEVLDVGELVTLQIRVRVNAQIPRLVVGYMIKDRLGQPMFGTNTDHIQHPVEDLKPGDTLTYGFRFIAGLGPGGYSVAVALHSTETHLLDNYEWRDLALVFNVVNMSRPVFVGNAWLPPRLKIERGRCHERPE